jgi:hypothetical protein
MLPESLGIFGIRRAEVQPVDGPGEEVGRLGSGYENVCKRGDFFKELSRKGESLCGLLIEPFLHARKLKHCPEGSIFSLARGDKYDEKTLRRIC